MSRDSNSKSGGGLQIKIKTHHAVPVSAEQVQQIEPHKTINEALPELLQESGMPLADFDGTCALELTPVTDGPLATESGKALSGNEEWEVVQAEVEKGLARIDIRDPLVGGVV